MVEDDRMSRSITILLPGSGHAPVGGIKVAYEYANRLSRRGHEVTIVHPASLFINRPLTKNPQKIVRYFQRRITGSYRPRSWFNLDGRVRTKWVPTLHERYIPDAEVVIATAWQTAEWLGTYPTAKGAKACLAYDYEHYMTASSQTQRTIALALSQSMKTISASPVVSEMLKSFGAKDTAYIPNGIDFEVFHRQGPANGHCRDSVGFPTRCEHFKGTDDAIRALCMVKQRFKGDLRFWSFGPAKPPFVPAWIEYHERPSDEQLRTLYNRTLVFAVPSHYEGWGLPGAEAMSCGAALASTDNGGVRVYAQHQVNALLSVPRDPEGLAENILQLLNDSALRERLVKQAHTDIQQFTWNKAVDSLERLIVNLCGPGRKRSMLTDTGEVIVR